MFLVHYGNNCIETIFGPASITDFKVSFLCQLVYINVVEVTLLGQFIYKFNITFFDHFIYK